MQSGRRLLDLINDVLDFSKNQAGLGAIADEPFSLPLLVDEIVAAHVRRALAKGLLLLPYIDPRVPERVRGDAGRLGQVLTNLLGNAIKFTERGEIRVEVRPADDEAERLHLIVDDTGIGIPFEAQQHIFEPFTQVDGSQTRRYGGTGLGLALARQQIELMGGELHLDSAPGRGSRFECRLALRAVGANRRPGDGRVLLVGPAAACRPALLAELQRAGVEVTVSDNPAAASQILRRASGTGPDLVLIDATLQAPDIAGLVGLADAHGRRCAGYGLPADDSLLPPALQSLLPEVIRAPVAYAAVCAVLLSQSAPAARPAGQVRAIDEAVTAQLVDSLGMQAFTTLIDSVEDSVHQRLEVCRAALAGGEMPRVRRPVHTMRGVAANLGAQRFAALCAALERSVAQGEARDPTADAARMSQLADALDEAVAALRAIATRTRVDLGQRARA